MAFSPNGFTVATAGDDQTIRTWSAETGAGFDTYPGQLGAVQALAAVVACLPRGWAPRLALGGQMLALVAALLLASVTEPVLWVHPFGPLTKNVPWLLGTLVVFWLTWEGPKHEC